MTLRTTCKSQLMDEEIRSFYDRGLERDRLDLGYSQIEFARTRELLERHLPPAPASVLDVGGGPGIYAAWLAAAGYDVRLVDASPLHVRQATELAAGRFSAEEGDARDLNAEDGSFDAVLLLGPLYHLTERDDRLAALREARRIVRQGGVVVAAAISRFASALDGVYGGYLSDPRFWPIVLQDLANGQHRSVSDQLPAFTTSYFHRPEELAGEVREAGFELDGLFGVEGPAWLLVDRWEDRVARENILQVARLLEQEPSVIGSSPHFLAFARKLPLRAN